jgi:hypothetical protein
MIQGATVPALTYSVAGLTNGDQQSSVLTGSPSFTISNNGTCPGAVTLNSSIAAGTYTICIAQDTLAVVSANSNYAALTGSSFQNGTLTVSTPTTQTITYTQIPTQTYGNSSINLNNYFSVNSPLALTYTITNGSAYASINQTTGSLTITGAGSVTVQASQPGGTSGGTIYAAATSVPQTFTVNPAALTVTAVSFSVPFGTASPAYTYSVAGTLYNGDTTSGTLGYSTTSANGPYTATSPAGSTFTIVISAGNFSAGPNAGSNYSVTYDNGTLSVSGNVAQTITFPPLTSPVTYGSAQNATVTASSGLPITSYTVSGTGQAQITSGSGSAVTITASGAGNPCITAYQAGNANYASATAKQCFVVNQATLTVTPTSYIVTVGSTIPTLGYSLSGFQLGDTAAVVSGALQLSTAATSSSGVGSYPISVSQSTLQATNYTFTYATTSAVNIVNKTAQTITFGALPNTTYGAGSITLNATATSGIPVTYSVVGPASVSGSVLTITGAGQVTVTANQSGNATYAAATPVPQVFTVAPVTLTVTAANASRIYGAANPAFTYTMTGFVNGDAQATATTGGPTLSTTATASSAVGPYPITVSQNTLLAANYTFNLVSGVLTVTSTTQVINFPVLSNSTYGSGVTLQATSTAGLPITYSFSGPIGNTGILTGVGTVTITASQPGNANVAAATPVTRTFTALPAVLIVQANDAYRAQGAPNPVFGYTITGFVNGDTDNPLPRPHNQQANIYVPEHRKVPHTGRGRAASGGFCAQTQLRKSDTGNSGADVRRHSGPFHRGGEAARNQTAPPRRPV